MPNVNALIWVLAASALVMGAAAMIALDHGAVDLGFGLIFGVLGLALVGIPLLFLADQPDWKDS